ncbi:MAG: hypothetical protein M3442_14350 [Chloroflexota bacterium]|nr:hypothetical protein [Chloroflexota bacterium]
MKPERTVHRFDAFAEYRKQEQEAKGDSERLARGCGLWVAKVVASRRHRDRRATGASGSGDGHEGGAPPQGEWHLLDGGPQTDALFLASSLPSSFPCCLGG